MSDRWEWGTGGGAVTHIWSLCPGQGESLSLSQVDTWGSQAKDSKLEAGHLKGVLRQGLIIVPEEEGTLKLIPAWHVLCSYC